jgi:hypothetical protein
MRLDTYPFPVNVNMINFEEQRVLVQTSQVDTTKGKRVIVLDKPRMRMITPKNPNSGKMEDQPRTAGSQGQTDVRYVVRKVCALEKGECVLEAREHQKTKITRGRSISQ